MSTTWAELAVLGEVGEEAVELLLRGQLAIQREEADLLVGGVLCEVADVVPAVDEDAVLTVDPAQPAAGDDDAFESALVGHGGILWAVSIVRDGLESRL